MANEREEQRRLESHEAGPSQRLSDGREDMGEAFADPNSLDDARLGKSFVEANWSGKRHHRTPSKAKNYGVIWMFVLGAVVLFAIIAVIGWIPRHERKEETERRARQQQEPEIEVVRVARAKDSEGLVVPGTTMPLTESSVYARASGYLKRRYVDIGDHVRKGQLLAVIDAPDLDNQVDQGREQVKQAEAQLLQQNTQLALTKITNDRYQALAARGVFSRQDADQRQADFDAQQANVHAAERNLEAFKANLGHLIALQSYERVTAPFDGIVTQRNVDTGDLIQAQGTAGGGAPTPAPTGSVSSGSTANGMTNNAGTTGSGSNLATPSTGTGGQGGALFTIAQANVLRILVSVPEGYAQEIRPGQHTALHFQEYPTQALYGDVTRTAGAIDQNTRTELVEIQIDNRAGKLLPGMYAVATFAAAKGMGPLVVSGDAIAIRKDQPMVAVIKDGKVKLTPVLIGRDYGPEVEILGGLAEGDLIASSFTDDVKDGASVKTRMNQEEEDKEKQQPAAAKPTPPGGSTQYGDAGIVDQDMQGQNAKPQQKQGNGAKKANGKGGSKP